MHKVLSMHWMTMQATHYDPIAALCISPYMVCMDGHMLASCTYSYKANYNGSEL